MEINKDVPLLWVKPSAKFVNIKSMRYASRSQDDSEKSRFTFITVCQRRSEGIQSGGNEKIF